MLHQKIKEMPAILIIVSKVKYSFCFVVGYHTTTQIKNCSKSTYAIKVGRMKPNIEKNAIAVV